jgi:ferrochelatase
VRADWSLVFQSRSGPPAQPWLEPDLLAHLRGAAGRGVRDVVLVPIGFVSDHMEVVYDLDVQAQAVARELGLNLVRAATVGTHPAFVAMIADLIDERLKPGSERRALGSHGPYPDVCPPDCCPSPHRGP